MSSDPRQAFIADLGKMAVDIIGLVKKKGGIGQAFSLLSDMEALIADGAASLPELKSIDGVEAGLLAAACYSMVKSILAAIVA